MKVFILLLFLFGLYSLDAQDIVHVEKLKLAEVKQTEGNYPIRTIILDNGLTVILNEDHTQKDVLGAVVVRGGSKLDNKDCSGIAHYFEHLMFKGTTTLGTVNYKEEKPYLDSIAMLYDLMRLDRNNEVMRERILAKIDSFSVIASKYAIPNEFSKVMGELGGSENNAYTNYENIVYYNRFPNRSINQWLSITADRFSSPVFRLFQSELETVYEEKNMSMDNMIRNVFQELYNSFYSNSVYGQRTVLGSIDDLRNPSINRIKDYWKYYYNAKNMAIVLIGDFNSKDIVSLVNNSFADWISGEKAKMPMFNEKPFNGREVVKKKLTPIPAGILGFRGVEKGNKDEIVLEVALNMLTNEAQTGLIDTLVIKQKLMVAEAMMDNHYDEGGIFILFVPKPIIQSIGNAEKKIINQIEILKSGSFSEDLFKAAKVSLYKDAVLEMENSNNRLSRIIDAYMIGGDYQSIENHDKAILDVKRADIIRVANKYFGENYLSFQSKMGFKSKEQLAKPLTSPLDLINKNSSSQKAIEIRKMSTDYIVPKFVSFEEDVKSYNIKSNLHFYYTANPLNDIFSLKIRIAYGTLTDPMTKQLAYYLNNTGTESLTHSEFSRLIQLMGSSIYFEADNDYFTISIDGFERNLDKTISKLNLLLLGFTEDKSLNKKMLKENKMEMKMLKKDLGSKISILEEYALYGDNSSYLNRLTNKELKRIKYEDLKALLSTIMNYEVYVHYVGQKKYSEVKEYMSKNLPSTLGQIKSQSPIIRPLPVLNHNMLYFLKDNHAIQSHIRFDIPSRAMAQEGRVYIKPFNDYFGIGMNSLIFREVREYRSLAYSAWGYFSVPYKFSAHSKMKIALSTQANKTNQAIELVDSLILLKKDIEYDISSLKNSVLNSINSDIPNFRYKSYIVQYWKMQGNESDPRINYYPKYLKLKAQDIDKFYKENVRGRKTIISIVGDSDSFDLEKLKIQREFKEVTFKEMIRY